jgi:hypothetical protein
VKLLANNLASEQDSARARIKLMREHEQDWANSFLNRVN